MSTLYYLYETDKRFIASYYSLAIEDRPEIKLLGTEELSQDKLKTDGYADFGGDYWVKEK